MLRLIRLCGAASVVGSFVLAGCGGPPQVFVVTAPSTTPTVLSVSVSCPATLAAGQGGTCTATAKLSSGQATVEGSAVTWQSSNANVASVTQSGFVVAYQLATVTITATFENVSGATSITIVLPPPPIATLKVGCPNFDVTTVCVANTSSELVVSQISPAGLTMTFGDSQACGPPLQNCILQIVGPGLFFPRGVVHAYQAGVFVAQLVVTDSFGQQASATATATVVSLSGTWISGSGSNGCTGQRTFQLVQAGTTLSGAYTSPAGATSTLSGTVGASPDSGTATADDARDVDILIPGSGLEFAGADFKNQGVSGDGTALILQITSGDVMCGQPTLTFRRQ